MKTVIYAPRGWGKMEEFQMAKSLAEIALAILGDEASIEGHELHIRRRMDGAVEVRDLRSGNTAMRFRPKDMRLILSRMGSWKQRLREWHGEVTGRPLVVVRTGRPRRHDETVSEWLRDMERFDE